MTMPITASMNNRDTNGQNSSPASQIAQITDRSKTSANNPAPAGRPLAISNPATTIANPAGR